MLIRVDLARNTLWLKTMTYMCSAAGSGTDFGYRFISKF
jgi:hypothetical protein